MASAAGAVMLVGFLSGAGLEAQATNASDTIAGPPPAVPIAELPAPGDTVVAPPGERYPAGGVHRFLFGDLHRSLWALPISAPVLMLDTVGGGLTLDELGGGKQTLGLHFNAANGLRYQFRSIVKTAERALPEIVEPTPVGTVLTDQMAAQFPLSAMVVAELLTTVDVLVAAPRPVVMPDDPRLGEYRELFAGRMGWIEERPDEREGDTPGFEGSSKVTGTDELFEELRDDPNSYVNQHAFLRARLIDMLVGDWDRHSDQWRWASFAEGNRQRWDPIPRDRDWAFSHIDGFLPGIASVYLPKYVGFGPEYPSVQALAWSAQKVDRSFLNELTREEFESEATFLVERLSDDAIDRAVGVLPPSYEEAIGSELRQNLRARRDDLPELARDFYRLLADRVDLLGTHEVDSVHIQGGPDQTRVSLWAPREDGGIRLFERVFRAEETREIRIYLRDAPDVAVLEGGHGITVRLVGGPGQDTYRGTPEGGWVRVYDSDDSQIGAETPVRPRSRPTLMQDSLMTAYMIWNRRDWGTSTFPRPAVRFGSDDGLHAGVELVRRTHAFGQDPWLSQTTAGVMAGLRLDDWILEASTERLLGSGGWKVRAAGRLITRDDTRFFGLGNGVDSVSSLGPYETHRTSGHLRMGVQYRIDPRWSIGVHTEWANHGEVQRGAQGFDALDPYGSDAYQEVALGASFTWDDARHEAYPTSATRLAVEARVVPDALDAREAYGTLTAQLRRYEPLPLPLSPVLQLRLLGETLAGTPPYFRRPSVGGLESVPGLAMGRFRGDHSVAATGLLRVPLLNPSEGIGVGLHALASAGRVWAESDPSSSWAHGFGGGVWARLDSVGRGVSFTVAGAPDEPGVRLYLKFGMLY